MTITIDAKATGEQIRKLCEDAGYTPEDISRLLNLDTSTPYYWFQGKSFPRWETAFNLAELLSVKGAKVGIEDLFVFERDDEEEIAEDE